MAKEAEEAAAANRAGYQEPYAYFVVGWRFEDIVKILSAACALEQMEIGWE
ncbi:MAG: hypothetical protein PHD76_01245 [Methylacidiphilales bacterium]|nr:hypothetical protein [Candidatus Methylacidiphilales bacterium]